MDLVKREICSELLKIFAGLKSEKKLIELEGYNYDLLKYLYEDKIKIYDIPTNDIIYLFIPFINSSNGHNIDIKEYIYRMIELEVIEPAKKEVETIETIFQHNLTNIVYINDENIIDPINVTNNILNGKYDRSEYLFIRKMIKELKYDYVDWDDRSQLLEILKYTFYKSLLLLRGEMKLKNVKTQKCEYITPKKMESFRIFECGHLNQIYSERSDLLQARLKPTMTQEEFSQWAKKDMEEREAKRIIKEEKHKKFNDLYSDNEKVTRDKEDDCYFLGNIHNKG